MIRQCIFKHTQQDTHPNTTAHPCCLLALNIHDCCFGYSKQVLYSRAALFKFVLRVVRDVDKAENGFAVTFIIVQSYAEELETDILEQG